MSGIYPQRISELIKGTRNFTIQQSIDIEKALGIGIEGYFYKIQANYEVYAFLTEKELTQHPDLSKFSTALFWDTRIEKINWIKNKEWVIQRIFEYGNSQEINEAIRFYGKDCLILKKVYRFYILKYPEMSCRQFFISLSSSLRYFLLTYRSLRRF